MDDPEILKTEKFGSLDYGPDEEFVCYCCGKTVSEVDGFVVDRFGRIYCCDECKNMEELI